MISFDCGRQIKVIRNRKNGLKFANKQQGEIVIFKRQINNMIGFSWGSEGYTKCTKLPIK